MQNLWSTCRELPTVHTHHLLTAPDHTSVKPVHKDSINTKSVTGKNLPATHPSAQSAVDLPEYYEDSKDNEMSA
jgi:hypothetical protein